MITIKRLFYTFLRKVTSDFLKPYVIDNTSKEDLTCCSESTNLFNTKTALKKLNINIEEELALIEKYQISPNELFLIRILILANEEITEEYMWRFLSVPEKMRGSVRESLISLQNKGIILKSYKIPGAGERFYPAEVTFNQNFLKTLYRSSYDLGQELFDAYPKSAVINGLLTPIRNVANRFGSLENFFKAYGKAIKYNEQTHREIIELVEWAKNDPSGYLCMSLANFVIERKWEDLKELRDREVTDTNKLI